MIQYNLKFRLFNSSSGSLYLIEEQSDQKKTYHYAYDLSDQFDEIYLKNEAKQIKECRHLRKHLSQITIQNKKYIVFKYQEGETLREQIKLHRVKAESIKFDTIKNYLVQMLETLYKLHSAGILGRVFTTNNIMDCNGQLLFLDFGYGPQLTNKNLDLCAPPEMIEYFEQNSKQKYGMKIDSWLLGAVLYHLVKLRPINAIQIDENRVKIMQSQDIDEYLAYIKKKMEDSDYIETYSSRYPNILCQFIEGLLTYNVDKRLSFSQIYHHNFIKSLNLPNYYQYLAFYEQFNQQNIFQQIQIVEGHESQIFKTDDHESQIFKTIDHENVHISKIDIPLLEKTIPIDDAYIFPSSSSPRRGTLLEVSFRVDIEKLFPFQGQDHFKNSRYYQIFQYIRMEQFRFTYLEITADVFIVELSKKKFQLEKVCAYFLRKMAYLILVELLKKLNEDACPWNCEVADRWQDFQKERLKDLLAKNLKEKIQNAEPVLKQLFNEECLIYLKDERVEKSIRDSLQADQLCFEKQKFDGLSIYNQSSQEFLRNGYRQLIKVTYKFVEREQSMAVQPEIKYNSILLRTILCYLINRIFDLNRLSGFFKNFLKNRTTQDVFSPNELYEYICKDDENKQEKDLKDIFQERFESH